MNILVVGAGFSGAVVARELAELNHKVTVIDKRDHIGGNAFDYIDAVTGIRVHKYGPHLFHTKSKSVFKYLSKFTEWVEYKHKVKAQLSDGRYVTLPVNKETKQIVGEENILDVFYKPYSLKMWGKPLDDIDSSVMKRVPIRDDDNEYYFPDDDFQYLPKEGYTKLIENMLSHQNIEFFTNTPFSKEIQTNFDHTFNSMPIDEYYDFKYGPLPYRSIKFHNTILSGVSKIFPTATVNFTDNSIYTRVTEWNHLPNSDVDSNTFLTYEEPCDYLDNNMERYYPVKDAEGINKSIYSQYKSIKNDKVTFIGRQGTYQYLDMDQVVNQTIQIVKKFKGDNG